MRALSTWDETETDAIVELNTAGFRCHSPEVRPHTPLLDPTRHQVSLPFPSVDQQGSHRKVFASDQEPAVAVGLRGHGRRPDRRRHRRPGEVCQVDHVLRGSRGECEVRRVDDFRTETDKHALSISETLCDRLPHVVGNLVCDRSRGSSESIHRFTDSVRPGLDDILLLAQLANLPNTRGWECEGWCSKGCEETRELEVL